MWYHKKNILQHGGVNHSTSIKGVLYYNVTATGKGQPFYIVGIVIAQSSDNRDIPTILHQRDCHITKLLQQGGTNHSTSLGVSCRKDTTTGRDKPLYIIWVSWNKGTTSGRDQPFCIIGVVIAQSYNREGSTILHHRGCHSTKLLQQGGTNHSTSLGVSYHKGTTTVRDPTILHHNIQVRTTQFTSWWMSQEKDSNTRSN